MKKLFVIIAFIISGISLSAQNAGVAADIGYTFNKRSMGYFGVSGSFYNSRPYNSSNDLLLNIGLGAGAYVGRFGGETKAIPAGSFNVGIGGALDAKVVASQHFINPSLGLNLLNAVKLHLGYSIPGKSISGIRMKGFTVGITLSFGTRGYYLDVSN
ncbi:hypothetical protein D0T84_05280 [Dysgonomonas sp. 521]|uniref:hypothetical protein n=1 Tax=Dysgonomonas sp. 521 TaxID=2302932 RepID=UPI0013D162ED|nr:hypothetical protein [Dysgonomonas sp. 521]NDV94330.1 hypothetical protein [Dysgonomonas sp. 521]